MVIDKIKLYNFSIILVSIFPVLGLKKSVYTIILWAFLSLVIFLSEKEYKNTTKKDLQNIFMLSLYFIAYFVSFLFSDDKSFMLKLLEQNVSFLIFPLFFILNKKFVLKSTLKNALIFFTLSNIILALYIWSIIISKGISNFFEKNNYYNPILRNIFSDVSEIHLPYLGLLFVFSSLFLINEILSDSKKNYLLNIVRLITIIILIFSVFTFAARTALILFIIGSIYLIFKKINGLKTKLSIALFFLITIFSLLKLPTIDTRVKEFTTAELILPSKGQSSEKVNFRYGIYTCVSKILKENWLFGVGVNNVQTSLNNCYCDYTYQNFDDFKHTTYNSHNQYFDTCLKYGIFGVIVFFFFLLWGIQNTDLNFKIFIFLILISLMTENIFNRQVGIVFFTYFNMLFFINKESN